MAALVGFVFVALAFIGAVRVCRVAFRATRGALAKCGRALASLDQPRAESPADAIATLVARGRKVRP